MKPPGTQPAKYPLSHRQYGDYPNLSPLQCLHWPLQSSKQCYYAEKTTGLIMLLSGRGFMNNRCNYGSYYVLVKVHDLSGASRPLSLECRATVLRIAQRDTIEPICISTIDSYLDSFTRRVAIALQVHKNA